MNEQKGALPSLSWGSALLIFCLEDVYIFTSIASPVALSVLQRLRVVTT